MKFFSIIFLVFFSSVLWANPINMACVTEYPTTSFIATTEGDRVNIRLLHHNGVQYMPIWNGLITPNDLSNLGEIAQTLSSLGSDLNFSMSINNCKTQDDFLISCFGGLSAVEINGHKVTLWGLYTAHDKERIVAGEFNNVSTNLALDIDGKTYYIPMKYSEVECFKDFSPQGIKKKLRAKNLFL